MPKLLTLLTASDKGALVETMALRVENMPGGIRKEDLVRAMSHRMSLREFEDAIAVLYASRRIDLRPGPSGMVYFPTTRT
jgi:hypothetical protein